MKRVITAEFVTSESQAGRRHIAAPRGQVVITPGAWSTAFELGVSFDEGPVEETGLGSCERLVDPSGVRVVRGDSVRLGAFAGAGPDRRVGLCDVVTKADGSPMSAGFMSWGRDDSFPWKLDYDEIDYVLEGVLHIHINGRIVEARAGDVVSIPKGSSIIFGTPSRTRVFYVTWPADWAQPPRPQK